MLEKLEGLTDSDYRGPRAGFTEAHVVRAILEIGQSASVGRGKLGRLLDLGQGEVRTLISRLKSRGLIVIKERGCALTREGAREYERLKEIVPWVSKVPGSALGLGSSNFAAIVRGRSKKVKMGIEQRDATIKSGSSGALTVIFSSGRFIVPGEWSDCESKGPSEPWIAIREGQPMEGDVIILCGALSDKLAEQGLWAAALTLLRN